MDAAFAANYCQMLPSAAKCCQVLPNDAKSAFAVNHAALGLPPRLIMYMVTRNGRKFLFIEIKISPVQFYSSFRIVDGLYKDLATIYISKSELIFKFSM